MSWRRCFLGRNGKIILVVGRVDSGVRPGFERPATVTVHWSSPEFLFYFRDSLPGLGPEGSRTAHEERSEAAAAAATY